MQEMMKEKEERHKMKVYGSKICVDCRNYLAIQKARGFDCDFIEITEETFDINEALSWIGQEPVKDSEMKLLEQD